MQKRKLQRSSLPTRKSTRLENRNLVQAAMEEASSDDEANSETSIRSGNRNSGNRTPRTPQVRKQELGKQTPRTPAPPWTFLSAIKEEGKALLLAPPSGSNQQSVAVQNPFLIIAPDGELPEFDKMIAPPEFDDSKQPREEFRELLLSMAHAVSEGSKHWAVVASCLGEGAGKELSKRPLILSAIAGVFLVIPPDGYKMRAEEGVDVLVFQGGKVKKETLSPQSPTGMYATETGSRPGARRKSKAGKKEKVIRFKTDIVVQGKDASGKLRDRLSIEHKGKVQHDNDRWESLSGACRTMQKETRAGSLESRHYAHLWSGETLQYQILDVFGSIVVSNGRITQAAYDDFLREYLARQQYAGESFPYDSVRKWVAMVDDIAESESTQFNPSPIAVPGVDPFGYDRMKWYLCHQQSKLVQEYEVSFPSSKYLVGMAYYQPEAIPSLVSTKISSDAAATLTLAILRIVLGDHVLNWSAADVKFIMSARLKHIYETAENRMKRDMRGRVNVFQAETMGVNNSARALQVMGGGWEVSNLEDYWELRIMWFSWERNGMRVDLQAPRSLQILEGPVRKSSRRTVVVHFPQDISTVDWAFYDDRQCVVLICKKAPWAAQMIPEANKEEELFANLNWR